MAKSEIAIFGGGCFWCFEAIFKELEGVAKVTSGYAGGKIKNPTYEQVSSGESGHAEVVKIEFNPEIIAYKTLLDIFFHTHNPTTKNRQGNDVGPQYRSIILYKDVIQKNEAENFMQKLIDNHTFSSPITTEIAPLADFYPAENYHQDYFATHAGAPYCEIAILPKLEKFKQKFSKMLK